MALNDGKCDSCGEKVDVLFPIGILNELPTGGEGYVQRWYCLSCKKLVEEEAEDTDDEDDKNTERPTGSK